MKDFTLFYTETNVLILIIINKSNSISVDIGLESDVIPDSFLLFRSFFTHCLLLSPSSATMYITQSVQKVWNIKIFYISVKHF